MGEYFTNKMTSIDQMQSGLFTDRVKSFLHKPPELRNKMFISPIIRVKENTNSRNSMFNLFVLTQTLGNYITYKKL